MNIIIAIILLIACLLVAGKKKMSPTKNRRSVHDGGSQKDGLSWIDDIEDLEAIIDD